MIYRIGRFLQIIGLIVMPFAIWVAQFGHSERGSITIFVGSLVIFFFGTLLVRFGLKG